MQPSPQPQEGHGEDAFDPGLAAQPPKLNRTKAEGRTHLVGAKDFELVYVAEDHEEESKVAQDQGGPLGRVF